MKSETQTNTATVAFTAALRLARLAALAADPIEDGGTCNFDSATIALRNLKGVDVNQAGKDAGVTAYTGKWFGEPTAWVGCSHGQGARRTAMAEAFCAALHAQDIPATMYYQMD
jgi:hypothetical protein